MDDKGNIFEVVISGVGGRFPKSENMEHLKANLNNKVNMVTDNDCRWDKGKFRVTMLLVKRNIFNLYLVFNVI